MVSARASKITRDPTQSTNKQKSLTWPRLENCGCPSAHFYIPVSTSSFFIPFIYMSKDANDPNCCLSPPILRCIPIGLFMELLKGVVSVVLPLHHPRKSESRSFCPPRKGGDSRLSLPCSSAHKLTPAESITSTLLVLYTEKPGVFTSKSPSGDSYLWFRNPGDAAQVSRTNLLNMHVVTHPLSSLSLSLWKTLFFNLGFNNNFIGLVI